MASKTPKGADIFKWAKDMQYQAIVIGNHDLILGVREFQKLIGIYDLPFIASNLSHPDLAIPPYKIVSLNFKTEGEMKSLRVGIIGIADECDYPTNPKKDYHFSKKGDKDALAVYPVYNHTMTRIIEEVSKESDLIILVSHNWDFVDKKSVAANLHKKICAIIGGHSHNVLDKNNVKGKSLIKSGVYGNCVGITKITYDTYEHKVVTVSVENHNIGR